MECVSKHTRWWRGGYVLLLSLTLLSSQFSYANPTELFISEYLEGSSYNKAIEIYNGTGATVNLSGYTLELYSNGNAVANATANLSGTVVSGDVYVISHASADAAILAEADLTDNSVINFNGDDTVVLKNGLNIIDVFGQVGTDPGSEWLSGGVGTQNETLTRKSTVCAGDTNGSDAFDPSLEWDSSAEDTITNLGSHSVSCGGVSGTTLVISATDATKAEGNSGTTNFTFTVTRSGDTSGTTDVDYAVSSSAADATDFGGTLPSGTVSFAVNDTTKTITVGVSGDTDTEVNENFTVTLSNPTNGATITTATANGTIQNDDGVALTLISAIQGNSATSPMDGQQVTIEGVVVASYQDATLGLGGFFVQEEDTDTDADSNTSEGIFVYCSACPDAVAEGQIVQVSGAVSEYYGMTQVSATTAGNTVVTNANDNLSLVSAATIDLPVIGDVDTFYEQYEGMLVSFVDTLHVSEYYQLGRYGQVVLFEGGRPFQYTHSNTPTAAGYTAYQADLASRQVILDDENNEENLPSTNNTPFYYPLPNGLSTGTQGTDFFRGGDTISGLVGVLHYSWAGSSGTDAWRVRPTLNNTATFTVNNPRPATPPSVGGNIKVASFNVLNYFDGPFPTSRGADSAAEFTRQTDKIVAAIAAIDADVIGLMELENDGSAIGTLVSAVNTVVGAGTYTYVNTGVVGSDEIVVGIMYKPAVLQAVGAYQALTTAAFIDPNNLGSDKNRPAIAQTFQVLDSNNPDYGEAFTVVMNHLKSKGSSCGTGDDDTTTGQGNCNGTRDGGAAALVAWLATDPTNTATNLGAVDTDILIMGDLNAYAKEDPIDTILAGSGSITYQDMLAGGSNYSYVFSGQLGYLDHVLASNSIAPYITSASDWHINADEVSAFDYNDTVDDAGEPSPINYELKSTVNPLYEVNAFRASDHDPVIVGLDFGGSSSNTVSDFNGDGKSDLVWQRTSGELAAWYMDGTVRIGSVGLGSVADTSWQVVGINDFNNDNKPDLVWQSTTGELAVWYMNGAVRIGSEGLGSVADTDWQIVGIGDFNNDSKPDLVWQRTSGELAVWYMDGATQTGTVGLGSVADTNWQVVGVGDFNNDSKPDLVWQRTTGELAVWYMNGTTKIGNTGLGSVTDTNWQVADVVDLNNDSKPDLVWQRTSGELAAWYMDDAVRIGNVGLGSVADTNWSIVGH